MSFRSIDISNEDTFKWADEVSQGSEEINNVSISSESEGSCSDTDQRETARNKFVRDIWEEDIIWAALQSLPEAEELTEAIKLEDTDKIQKFEHALATGVLLSAHLGKPNILKELLSKGASVHIRDIAGRTPLHLASNSCNLECIKLLIVNGAEVNCTDLSRKIMPLHCVASKGSLQCLRYLIKCGADYNTSRNTKTPLHYAVECNALDCVKELLALGASPNTLQVFSETPLHVAASIGSPEIIKLLLKSGASVNVQYGRDKSTALHLAVEDGNTESLAALIEAQANISALNFKKQTPLHIAALSQSVESIELLLKKGADPNAIDIDGRSPLHNAIVKVSRSSECVRVLLLYGANVNLPDAFGYTPLHLAALNEFSNCVLLLLNYGGDVTARTNGGVSVLTFITRRTPDVIPRYITKLDNSIRLTDHEIGDVDCELKLDFKILVPSPSKGETELLLNFIEVGHREILKHPLCETFLFLKWRRIRKYFLFSLFYHALFVILFTAYTIDVFIKHCEPELESDLDDLIAEKVLPDCSISTWSRVIANQLIVLNILLLLKEIFQIIHSWLVYIKHWENWLQWLIIISVFCCVVPKSDDIRRTMHSWQHHVAAIGIFLTWLELMMIVGRFPIFGLYIQMFKTVAVNFIKFLLAYLCLLIAFTLSFGVLFANHPAFEYVFSGIIKVIIMMSGELEFDDTFNSNYQTSYAGTAHVMFLIFVLLVTIILTNLMVGLAVSDIQGLQQSAGLDRLVRQAELVAHLESMLFSRLLRCISPKFLAFFYKYALLMKSQQNCALYIRPNDPREERIPKELTKSIYSLVVEKKFRARHKRRTIKDETRISNTSQQLMTRINSSNDYLYMGKIV